MDKQALLHESPKVFAALARFLNPAELRLLSEDYQTAKDLGGDVECGLTREEGVSYNPRLARVLLIMARDLGCTDIEMYRVALYAAVFDTGLGVANSAAPSDFSIIPDEIRELVANVQGVQEGDTRSGSISGVIALDAVRHLHLTRWEATQRESILVALEDNLMSKLRSSAPEILVRKLQVAINLQRRRLVADRARA
jgi:hypothetical protein